MTKQELNQIAAAVLRRHAAESRQAAEDVCCPGARAYHTPIAEHLEALAATLEGDAR